MKVNNNSNGIGFVGALTIAFIVLKLMKIIDWSWWWYCNHCGYLRLW